MTYLPLSHIAGQIVDIYISMKYGAVVYFAKPDALKVCGAESIEPGHEQWGCCCKMLVSLYSDKLLCSSLLLFLPEKC